MPSTSHRLALSHQEAPLACPGLIPLALFYPSTFSLGICCPAVLLMWRKQRSALLFALKQELCRRVAVPSRIWKGPCRKTLMVFVLKQFLQWRTATLPRETMRGSGAFGEFSETPSTGLGLRRVFLEVNVPNTQKSSAQGYFGSLLKHSLSDFFIIYFWILVCHA